MREAPRTSQGKEERVEYSDVLYALLVLRDGVPEREYLLYVNVTLCVSLYVKSSKRLVFTA
jgi:hypothetical protein